MAEGITQEASVYHDLDLVALEMTSVINPTGNRGVHLKTLWILQMLSKVQREQPWYLFNNILLQ